MAVITGGTTGIGFAIAETFGKEGGKVAICSRSEKKVDNAINLLKEQNIDVYGESVDVSSKNSLQAFADLVEEKYGGIDIWINNAGIYPQFKIIDTPEDTWEDIMNINVKSVYLGSQIALEKLQKRKGGVIINAASFASLMPSIGSGGYAASKAAVHSLTKTLAGELAPYNIRVNGFIPGVIETTMTSEIIAAKGEQLVKQIPMKRVGTSQEVANAVLFLCSDQASYITGAFIEITGGKLCVQNP